MNRYLYYQKSNLSDFILEKIKVNNLVVNLESPQKIMGNSVIIQFNGLNLMYLNSELPHQLKTYAILHELGHIEANLIGENFNTYDKDVEKEVEKHALNLLNPFISKIDRVICSALLNLPDTYLYKKLLSLKELELEEEVWNKILSAS